MEEGELGRGGSHYQQEELYVCVHVHISVAYCCRWLAYTLVCVNVALTVRAGVCHILEVVDQTGNQAAA